MLIALAFPDNARALEIIVVDPGHGGYDSGIREEDSKEKDIALIISKHIAEIFQGLKKKVFLTRKVDQHLSISERVSRANRRSPDLFLSIHQSGSEDFAVYVMGYEKKESEITLRQYYSLSSRQRKHLYESKILAGIMEDVLREGFGGKVYHREMPLPLLSSMGAPALQIEVPSKGMDYDEEMLRVASSIVLGLLYYEERW